MGLKKSAELGSASGVDDKQAEDSYPIFCVATASGFAISSAIIREEKENIAA